MFAFIFVSQQATAQCGHGQDVTAPIAKCRNITVALESNGFANVDPQDVDNGSSDNCGSMSFQLRIQGGPNRLIRCSDIPNGQQTGALPAMLIVTDSQNNSNTCNLTLTVQDNLPPIIPAAAIPNRTYTCNNVPAGFPGVGVTGNAEPGTTDNCGVLSVTFNDVISGTQPHCYTITRTWTATDIHTNVSTRVQTLTVQDLVNPTFVLFPANANLECNDPNAFPNPNPNPQPKVVLTSSNASDNCTPSITPVNTLNRDSRYTYPNIGAPFLNVSTNDCEYYDYTITHQWTITDNCGNSATRTQTVTVSDNTPPTYSGSDFPANGGTLTVPALNGCGATFPNAFANLDLRDNVNDNCAPNAVLDGSFTVRNATNNALVNSGNTLNANATYPTGTYNFVYTVSDPCGNSRNYSFTISIVDNVAPTAKCRNIRASVPASGILTILAVDIDNSSVDNCPGTLTYAVNPSAFNCSHIGGPNEMVTLTVTDASGNSANCTSMIEIVDETGPAPLCKNAMVSLDASGNVTITPSQVDNGSFDACGGVASSSVSPNTFNCSNIGTNIVTLTVTDGVGNSSTCTAVVTVKDDMRPSFTCIVPSYSAQLDANGMANVEPGWLIGGSNYNLYMQSFGNGTTCNNEYTVTTGSGSSISFDWMYESGDVNGAAAYEKNGVVTVLASGIATTSGNAGPISLVPGDVFKFRTVSRNNNQRVELIITNFTVNGNPGYPGDFDPANWVRTSTCPNSGAWIVGNSLADNCTDIFNLIKSLTPNPILLDCDDVPSATVTITATDAQNNTFSQNCTVLVSDDVDPAPICRDFNAQLDDDDDDFNLNGSSDGPGDILVEPGWLISGERKLYMMSGSSTPNGNTGFTEYKVKVKTPTTINFTYNYQPTTPAGAVFRDAFGYVKNGVFVALETTGNPNPNGSHSVSVAQGDIFGFRTTTRDDVVPNPDFSGSAKVVISFGTPNFFVGDFDPVKWERTNANTSWSKYMFITYEGVFISGTAIGDACSDVCDIEMRINDDGSAVNDNSIPAAYALYTCGDAGITYPATVSITDAANNVGTCTSNLTIIDEIDPVINFCPTTTTAVLDANGEYDTEAGIGLLVALFATDNCDIDRYTSVPALLNCTQVGQTIPVRTTVFDSSNNSTFCTTQVTVQDNSEPELLCPAPITINCGDSTNPSNTGMATATDNCGVVSITTNPNNDVIGTCSGGSYTISRTWIATDGAGNVDQCVQTITVNDNVGPVLSSNPPHFVGVNHIECSPLPAITPVTASDACSGNLGNITPTLTSTQGNNPASCDFYNYNVTRTYRATDNCGNATVHTQNIEVRDTQAPVISGLPTMYSTDPNSCVATITSLNFASYVTDCAADANLRFTANSNPNSTPYTHANGTYVPGTYFVTFYVTDPCGNQTFTTFSFVVRDNQVPQVNTQNFTVTLSGTNPGSISPQDVDNGSVDNCGIDRLILSQSTFDCSDLGQNTVTLTVIDINGNQNTGTAIVTVVGNACSSFTVNTSSTNESAPGAGNGSVTATVSPSGTYTYMWTDSNGNPVGNTATVNGLTAGTYTVKVTDTATNQMVTATAVVGSNAAPGVRFIVGNVSGAAGTMINLPITVENFTNVVSFGFSVKLTNAAIADVMSVVSVSPLVAANLTWSIDDADNRVDISYASNMASPHTTGNGNTILNIKIMLGGTTGQSTPGVILGFNGNPIEVSQNFGSGLVFSSGVGVNGSATINNAMTMTTISGRIRNDNTVGVENVTVQLIDQSNNTILDTDLTDANGDYVLDVEVGKNVIIRPISQNNSFPVDIDFWKNGVTTGDAAIIQGHSANIAALRINDITKLIAADVSNNATAGNCIPSPITAGDALIIQALVVGNISRFPNNESWKFIDASHVFTDPNCPYNPQPANSSISINNVGIGTVGVNFTGIKIGDVGASRATPILLTNEEVDERNSEKVTVITDDMPIVAGEQYRIPFYTEGFENIISCQFTMEFDANFLAFEEAETGDLPNISSGNFGLNFVNDGYLNFGWFRANPVSLDSEVPVFYLTFTALTDAENLSEVLSISSLYTKKEAFTFHMEELDVVLDFTSNVVSSNIVVEAEQFILNPNQPNPFSNETTISFSLTEAAKANLEIIDATGKVLKTYQSNFAKGYNEILVSEKDLPNGILYYRLSTDKHVATRKMILMK